MLSEYKTGPNVINDTSCCLLPQINRRVQPISLENGVHVPHLNSHQEDEQRQTVETHVFSRLEEYSTRKSIHLFHLSSLSHIRRRLHRDAKFLSRQFAPKHVSEQKILQWIDDTLERIDSHWPQLRTLLESEDDLLQSLNTGDISSTKIDSHWEELQLERAKILLPKMTNHSDREILTDYRNYILKNLTPTQIENDRLFGKNQSSESIDLNSEYSKAEKFGRTYLKNLFDNYKQRRYPNMKLLKEMIELGMEQMIKRPKTDELRRVANSSNILLKANLILKSKRAYAMSLKNLADDFMLLRFGRIFDEQYRGKDSISERFMSLIHMFLNSISLLIRSLRSNLSDIDSKSFHTEFPSTSILSPLNHVDQWTWLLEKWKLTLQILPIHLTRQGAFGRLVRTTIGVGIARLYGIAENDEQDEIDQTLFQALQMGFYYGIAYALVDGLQDNQQFDENKKEQQHHIDIDKWLIDMEKILCGDQLNRSNLPQLPITPLLLETFDCLVQLTSMNNIAQQTFTDLALLLRSQRWDKKDLSVSQYDDVDLFLGSLMKSHFTYTATAFMGGARMVHSRERLWTMPFLGQLTDDCRDFNEDRHTRSFTPVTYFAQHIDSSSSINPFFVFLFVSEDIYLQSHQEKQTGAFLGRRIMRTLRALQTDLPEFLKIFTENSYPDLYSYMLSLQNLFSRVSDPEKTIFRSVNTFASNYAFNHRRLETFAYDTLPLIEANLPIMSRKKEQNLNPLVRGMNHSLQAGGKRLRPLLLLMVAQLFHIDIKRVLPLARAIEYLHTSSLIFDDLPAQDNAPMRRGQPTLHMPIGDDDDIPPSLTEGRAQLAAVDLIAHAISLVNVGLREEGFSFESINRVTAELAQSMNELCYGQFLDLQCARMGKKRTNPSISLAELDQIAQLKTGKAIEVVLVCPAMLIDQSLLNISLDRLRELGQLMGILFQMKDDLLDIEGDTYELGKMIHIDEHNQTMTYPRVLGIPLTRQRIDQMRKQAENILDELWPQAGTIRDVIRHICERHK